MTADSFATGGLGTSVGLGPQGAAALGENGRVLLAVDSGSDDVASLHVERGGLDARNDAARAKAPGHDSRR